MSRDGKILNYKNDNYLFSTNTIKLTRWFESVYGDAKGEKHQRNLEGKEQS